jgi:ATPase subunit of ABC transporter with duplicated ATPase domains
METRVIAAQQLALKRSGQRGHDARQAQLAVETEFAQLKAQDPQNYITPDIASDLITDVFDKFALIDLDARKAKARKILRGLGFEEARVETRVQTLSGGWRMQIALAKALFVGPDILLLDEPSMSLYSSYTARFFAYSLKAHSKPSRLACHPLVTKIPYQGNRRADARRRIA